MDTKRLAIGTVVGGIAMFAIAYLIWDIALDYWNAAFVASGVSKPQVVWGAVLSNVAHAALVTLAIDRCGASTIGAGVKVGAIVGFLVWSGVDLAYYANTTIFDLTTTIFDPLLASVHFAIGGGVIAAVLSRR